MENMMDQQQTQQPAKQPPVTVEQKTVLAKNNQFERHPDSYDLRVFVHVTESETETFYELLQTGQAIPWTKSPEGHGFDFWIIDVGYTSDIGVHRG